MRFTKNSPDIRSNYGITTDSMDKRVTLRLDRDSAKCLELAYATAISSDQYSFPDRASFLRWLIHEAYRELVEGDQFRRFRPPVCFRRPESAA